GRDTFEINVSGMPAKTSFTVFLLETPVTPFGAAEYIGDFTTDKKGRARQKLTLIVQEAFASTLVNGQRQRVDLNHVGVWFADPAGQQLCAEIEIQSVVLAGRPGQILGVHGHVGRIEPVDRLVEYRLHRVAVHNPRGHRVLVDARAARQFDAGAGRREPLDQVP